MKAVIRFWSEGKSCSVGVDWSQPNIRKLTRTCRARVTRVPRSHDDKLTSVTHVLLDNEEKGKHEAVKARLAAK